MRFPAALRGVYARWYVLGAALALSLLVVLLLHAPWRSTAPAVPLPRITALSKVVGLADQIPGAVPASSDGRFGVFGADLGAITRYGDQWYMALGDTYYAPLQEGLQGNFLVGTSRYQDGDLQALPLDGYLALRPVADMEMPFRAIRPDPGYTIPGGMFTVEWHGHEYMIGAYMEGGSFWGNDHWSRDTKLTLYDSRTRVFRPYKPRVYTWRRTDKQATDADRLQYNFAQDSFWEDPAHTFLYMIGSPASRFGGVKLARIPVASFVNPDDNRAWSYYLGGGRWSPPVADEMRIDATVPWLIPPVDPSFSLDKNYDTLHYAHGANQCQYLSIAEFSVVWNPYLQRFLLLTTQAGCPHEDLEIYSAPAITGPWTSRPEHAGMPFSAEYPSWDYYAPYTTSSLLRDGGRQMYFLASTYQHYGVYLYRADFPVVTVHKRGADLRH